VLYNQPLPMKHPPQVKYLLSIQSTPQIIMITKLKSNHQYHQFIILIRYLIKIPTLIRILELADEAATYQKIQIQKMKVLQRKIKN